MREASVGSPATAYRWIAAYTEGGGSWGDRNNGLGANRVPADVAEQIVALREHHPTWGKVRISRTLEQRYGAPVVSPTGVRSILREVGLWIPTDIPNGAAGPGEDPEEPIVPDQMLAALRRGIQLDLFNRPLDAIHYLEDLVCRPLLRQPHLISPLLQEPEFGSWLLRGGMQLAHALFDTGRWASALRYLRLIEFWLVIDESRPSSAQIAYQDAGDWWITEIDREWRAVAIDVELPTRTARISLRRDDIWLEAQRYLGIILRDAPGDEAENILTGALQAARGQADRKISPRLLVPYQGISLYNLAVLMSRRHYPHGMIYPGLAEAAELFHHSGDLAMLGSAEMLQARVASWANIDFPSTSRSNEIEQAIYSALTHASNAPQMVARARLAIEGTDLLLGFRDSSDEDRVRLEFAAELCREHGFAAQARKFLEYRRVRELMPEVEESLAPIAWGNGALARKQ